MPALELLQTRPSHRIGVLEGRIPFMFGNITDLVVDRLGNVTVLDELAYELRRFDSEGEWLGSIGREGGGPGEFGALYGMAIDSLGVVYVGDPRNRRISAFQATDRGLVLTREVAVRLETPSGAGDFCLKNEGFVVHSYSEDGLFHELDRTGAVLRSFGEPLSFPIDPQFARYAPYLRDIDNWGTMECLAGGGFVFLHGERGVLRYFPRDKGEAWRITLTDFTPIRRERGTIGVRMAFDPKTGTADYGTRTVVADSLVFVTVVESVLEGHRGYELRVHRLSDGAEVGRAPMRSRLDHLSTTAAYGIAESPYPQVLVYKRDR